MNVDIDIAEVIAFLVFLTITHGASWKLGHWMGMYDGEKKYNCRKEGDLERMFNMGNSFGSSSSNPNFRDASEGTGEATSVESGEKT